MAEQRQRSKKAIRRELLFGGGEHGNVASLR